jgi:thioredoxin-like negative regulator of GroEL
VGDSYGVRELPATVYVGRDGKIVEKVLGVKEHDEIEAAVKKALSHRR